MEGKPRARGFNFRLSTLVLIVILTRLSLCFKRIENVHAQKGHQGPVVVCGVQFLPLAGYGPERLAIKWLMAQQDMEIWLAPIPGTRIVVPYRIALATPLGRGVLEATEFVTAASPRSTPASR